MRIQFISACGLFAFLTLTIGAPPAFAQDGKRPDPTDPRVPAPAVKPGSAFSDYQPFREQQIRSWKEANQEVADNPGMGSMGSMPNMPGMSMPGMDSKPGAAPKSKAGAAGHDMGAMPGMDSKSGAETKSKAGAAGHDMGAMPGMDSKSGAAPKAKAGAAGHDMGAMPGMASKSGAAPKGKAGSGGHDMGAMPGMASKSGNAQNARLTGTGVVQGVDKANGKVKLTHDPIAAMGWPKMTIFFRLKDSSLADRVKEGDKVEFSLAKSAAGYVISDIQKSVENRDAKQAK